MARLAFLEPLPFVRRCRGRIVEKVLSMGLAVRRLSFGAPKPASHRRLKPATVWGVLVGRIVLFEPVCKGGDQVVAV